MRDTSFCVSPIRDHAFFEQTVLQHLLGQRFFQVSEFGAQCLNLATVGLARGVAGQALLSGFQEVLRPTVIKALSDNFAAAKGRNAVLTTQPFKTIRIFSSAEYCLRVLRRMSRTVFSAADAVLIDFCLIFVPLRLSTMSQKSSVMQSLQLVP